MNGVRLENILVAQEFNIQTVVHSEEQNNIPFSDWGTHTEECRVEFHHEFMMFCFAYPLAVSESHK